MRSSEEGTKTISLDDEAYRILASLKVSPRDSFSRVVKRPFRRSGRLRASAGAWSEVTDDEVRALCEETLDTFETAVRRL